jgi:hypothetical protein
MINHLSMRLRAPSGWAMCIGADRPWRLSNRGVAGKELRGLSGSKSFGLSSRPKRFSRQPIHKHPPHGFIPAFFQMFARTKYISQLSVITWYWFSHFIHSSRRSVGPSAMPGAVLILQSTQNQLSVMLSATAFFMVKVRFTHTPLKRRTPTSCDLVRPPGRRRMMFFIHRCHICHTRGRKFHTKP